MAIAVDGSTPARFTNTWNTTTGGSITSASFTAPADALLVLCGCADTSSDTTGLPALSASDSGGLTWTTRVARSPSDGGSIGGYSFIGTARTTSSTSRTVSLNGSSSGSGRWGTGRASAKCYVLTGVDVDGTPVDTVGASNEGSSTSDPTTTTSVTPGANGLLVVCCVDWTAQGATWASSDLTFDVAYHSTQIDVASGYKTCTSGVGVTANLNPKGAPDFKWCQITVREAGGGGAAGHPAGRRLSCIGRAYSPYEIGREGGAVARKRASVFGGWRPGRRAA